MGVLYVSEGNEIQRVEGLEGCRQLRELILDGNRIAGLSETSLAQNWQLQELHLEDNRLRDLANLAVPALERLARLFLSSNRIQVTQLPTLLHFRYSTL